MRIRYNAIADKQIHGYNYFMDNLFSESTSQIVQSGRVKTSSAIYKFWLSKFRGFTIERKIQTPQKYAFGRLSYKTSWILKPDGKN